jgi:glycosyltransferase involved in cell wall biosynthesis
MPLKILHLFSDWKWTGPADPTVSLCKELEKRGHEVLFAHRTPPPGMEVSLQTRVAEAGINATTRFHLNHGLKLTRPRAFVENLKDLWNLTRYLRENRFDVLNVHHSHDHVIGGLAARRSGVPLPVIRTDHKRDFIAASRANRALMARLTDGMIVFSEKQRGQDMAHFGFPPERVALINPALPLDRYDPRKEFKEMRKHFGIAPDEVVIGMIARYQKYRRTEVMLEALKQIVQVFPKVKLLLVGRSSQFEESVVKPMKKLGVDPWVVLGGYQTTHYLDTLASMDIFVFLMAGSDGTARALREAMAMGKPSVVADRGILPDLVEDGVSGLVVKDTAEGLAGAALDLLQHPEKRQSMGQAAYRRAREQFRLDRQVETVETFYEEMIRLGRWNHKRN